MGLFTYVLLVKGSPTSPGYKGNVMYISLRAPSLQKLALGVEFCLSVTLLAHSVLQNWTIASIFYFCCTEYINFHALY